MDWSEVRPANNAVRLSLPWTRMAASSRPNWLPLPWPQKQYHLYPYLILSPVLAWFNYLVVQVLGSLLVPYLFTYKLNLSQLSLGERHGWNQNGKLVNVWSTLPRAMSLSDVDKQPGTALIGWAWRLYCDNHPTRWSDIARLAIVSYNWWCLSLYKTPSSVEADKANLADSSLYCNACSFWPAGCWLTHLIALLHCRLRPLLINTPSLRDAFYLLVLNFRF